MRVEVGASKRRHSVDLAAIRFVEEDAPAPAVASGPDLHDLDLLSQVSVVHGRRTRRSQELPDIFFAVDELHLDEPMRDSRHVRGN